jgi:hypothetical protein
MDPPRQRAGGRPPSVHSVSIESRTRLTGWRTNLTPRCHAVALVLLGLLTACASHPIRPETKTSWGSPQVVPDSVLVLKSLPDGQFEQSWQPASAWSRELSSFRPTADVEAGRIVFAASRPRDCDQEQIDCHRECMKHKPPYPYGPKGGSAHVGFCNNKCLILYEDCLKAQGLMPLRFQAVNQAADWLRQHQNEIAVGGIILIAGGAFFILSGGAGLLVLAPLVLLP